MSSRLARNVASSATRYASTRASTSARMHMGRKNMSTVHETAAKSNDKLWIAGSLLIFGPAFLYLVSPSARKNRHDLHNDKHDFPGFHPKEEASSTPAVATSEPEIMKDDEGTPANVAESIKLSETSDVPQGSQSPEVESATKAAAEGSDATEKPAAHEIKTSDGKGGDKQGTFKGGEEGPTDQEAPRVASQQGITPKEKTEGKHESKEELAKSKA